MCSIPYGLVLESKSQFYVCDTDALTEIHTLGPSNGHLKDLKVTIDSKTLIIAIAPFNTKQQNISKGARLSFIYNLKA